MSPKELAEKTIKDIAAKREKADREFYGYQKESGVKEKNPVMLGLVDIDGKYLINKLMEW
ncbi:hypothetical protein [Clostridium taeniosporum]|uniref:hypothetical protein n=1 Tax=Clostridium taeniosporum TaxID=394958 RepID=UPI0018642322|nr:hypothetical protein [Clostridium taeniosporum]